jgi:hypothetical protein
MDRAYVLRHDHGTIRCALDDAQEMGRLSAEVISLNIIDVARGRARRGCGGRCFERDRSPCLMAHRPIIDRRIRRHVGHARNQLVERLGGSKGPRERGHEPAVAGPAQAGRRRPSALPQVGREPDAAAGNGTLGGIGRQWLLLAGRLRAGGIGSRRQTEQDEKNDRKFHADDNENPGSTLPSGATHTGAWLPLAPPWWPAPATPTWWRKRPEASPWNKPACPTLPRVSPPNGNLIGR